MPEIDIHYVIVGYIFMFTLVSVNYRAYKLLEREEGEKERDSSIENIE